MRAPARHLTLPRPDPDAHSKQLPRYRRCWDLLRSTARSERPGTCGQGGPSGVRHRARASLTSPPPKAADFGQSALVPDDLRELGTVAQRPEVLVFASEVGKCW